MINFRIQNYENPFFMDAQARARASVIALWMVYGFGIAGMFSPWKSWFVSMTPASILLSYGILWWNHGAIQRGALQFGLFAFGVGFLSEVMGVNTGFPFGDYSYGALLGLKIWNTPLLIGVNWTLVCYCACTLADRLWSDKRTWGWLLCASLIPVILDVLIEPVAIRLDFWSWESGTPPMQNYAGWWGVSLLIAQAYRVWMPSVIRNPLSGLLLALQFLFFGVLQGL
ncbi:MAG: carotenoid biosynthesis protein [Bacteroidetes bacterium]|nr:carotenoid biosynthesis protein [Bacteroidota bacterium]